jgi:hypothetical protein
LSYLDPNLVSHSSAMPYLDPNLVSYAFTMSYTSPKFYASPKSYL